MQREKCLKTVTKIKLTVHKIHAVSFYSRVKEAVQKYDWL